MSVHSFYDIAYCATAIVISDVVFSASLCFHIEESIVVEHMPPKRITCQFIGKQDTSESHSVNVGMVKIKQTA